MHHYNTAQQLLAHIGGTAELVAGIDGHYWADASTPVKQHHRPRKGRGDYGLNLKAHFDSTEYRYKQKRAKH